MGNILIDEVLNQKNNDVIKIINLINQTNDNKLRSELVFTLIDNFKDKRIIPALIDLIKREDLKNHNASFVFACNEYSPEECKNRIDFFIDLVINGDYETSMASAQLILDFPEPYKWSENLLDKLENKLRVSLEENIQNKEFIIDVLKMFSDDD